MTASLFDDLPESARPDAALPVSTTLPRDWPFGALEPGAYDVIVADPPWTFELRSDRGGCKSPQAAYECQGLDWIRALPVKALARPNAMLFLWTTWPLMALGTPLDVARAWGFAPVSGGSWAKRTATGRLRWGTGYAIRTTEEPFLIGVDDASEPFLVAKAGAGFRNPGLPNHIDGLAREHSRKPDEFFRILENATPGRRRCDLFSGGQTHEGFEGWGHDHRAGRVWEGMV